MKFLKRYNIGELLLDSVVLLPSMANHVWAFNSSTGRYVLKEFLDIKYTDLHLNHELQILLSQHGFYIPEIILNKNNETLTVEDGRIFEIRKYIPHQAMGYPEMKISHQVLHSAATTLALFHRQPSSLFSGILFIDPLINRMSEAISLVKTFIGNYEALIARKDRQYVLKLAVLRSLIEYTNSAREVLAESKIKYNFTTYDIVQTHGDFNPSNLLYSLDNKELYIIDWDSAAYRPRAWEIQKTISQFCGKGFCNPYLDVIDLEKAKTFLKAYHASNPLTRRHLKHMSEIAEFNYAYSWVGFTLIQILRGDSRILTFIPDELEKALFWAKNLKDYFLFLNSCVP